jgi:adenosylcobinamide-GDP ribazoletransferase
VAGTVPVRVAWGTAALVVLGCTACGALFGVGAMAWSGVASLLGLAAAEGLLRRCRERFGGVTGDVFGALCETAVTTSLVVCALGLA